MKLGSETGSFGLAGTLQCARQFAQRVSRFTPFPLGRIAPPDVLEGQQNRRAGGFG
ncbi:hypothetical protein LGM71_26665 [Burkholderia sp. AU33545]|uniref:hypothetical protein n=1 Tax=Burkholderia sp. AU33545 TaxID=2879631 RepID=UPI001CF4D0EF|nr:hypothetical protein [Burkholderia sp. AU33545]MCA8204626.1 hypothetical protein [Burkholderia sp. AU33545]